MKGNILSFTTTGTVNFINNNIINGTNGSTGKIVYENSSTENLGNTNSIPSTTNDNYFGNNLSANTLFGFTNFLPKTFIGWLIFLILIFIIIIIGRKLYEDYSYRKKINRVDANHIENLPV